MRSYRTRGMREYYWVVGVAHDAQPGALRQVFRQLARHRRSSASGLESDGRQWEIQHAYEVAGDDERRRIGRGVRSRPCRYEPSLTVARGWSSDEIDLDFPSVASVVDRIGDAFRRNVDGGPMLSADVSLTAREAESGVTTSLEVPVQCTCPVCGGRGEVWEEPCGVCRGTGAESCQHLVRLAIPPGVRSGARFRFEIRPSYAPVTPVEVRIAIR